MLLFALIVVLVQGCLGVTVVKAPSDTGVEKGQNVTLACVVTNKADNENVQWKHRTNSSSSFNALTFNDNVLGSPDKYAIVSTYNLTIVNAAFTDEGTYRCTAGTTDYDAFLAVADLPDSVSITWDSSPIAGETVNLTCSAINARPVPSLKWMLSGLDLTHLAVSETSALATNGYGTRISHLPLTLTAGMDGTVAVCYVTYPGWPNAMNTSMTFDINSVAGIHVSPLAITLGVVFLFVLL